MNNINRLGYNMHYFAQYAPFCTTCTMTWQLLSIIQFMHPAQFNHSSKANQISFVERIGSKDDPCQLNGRYRDRIGNRHSHFDLGSFFLHYSQGAQHPHSASTVIQQRWPFTHIVALSWQTSLAVKVETEAAADLVIRGVSSSFWSSRLFLRQVECSRSQVEPWGQQWRWSLQQLARGMGQQP